MYVQVMKVIPPLTLFLLCFPAFLLSSIIFRKVCTNRGQWKWQSCVKCTELERSGAMLLSLSCAVPGMN